MACDIHISLEVNNGNQWECIDPFISVEADSMGIEYEVYDEVFEGRYYDMFGALCGVRSCVSEDEMISPPKGLPGDISDTTRSRHSYWGEDAHCESWNTLQELYTFQESRKNLKRRGWITEEQAEYLDKDPEVPVWHSLFPEEGLVYREWVESEDYLDDLIYGIEERLRTTSNYAITHEDVRIVYWFDW